MRDDILELVYAAIDDLNGQSAGGLQIQKSPDARLLGKGTGLDSLTFVNLVVAVEGQIESRLNLSVVLVDENSMALQDNPFRTVASLAAYVEEVVARQRVN